jgi:hypothetical protein
MSRGSGISYRQGSIPELHERAMPMLATVYVTPIQARTKASHLAAPCWARRDTNWLFEGLQGPINLPDQVQPDRKSYLWIMAMLKVVMGSQGAP